MLIYGRSASAIASAFGITTAKAQKLINDWFKAAPEAEKWIKATQKQPFSGEEYVTPFGRTRHYVITNENRWHISNEAVNMPIQSIASDITLMSIIDIQHWLDEEDMGEVAKIVATVHDSIVLEVDDDADIIAKVIKVGKSIMSSQADKFDIGPIKVPFKADAEYGYAYGSMKEVEL